VPIPTQCAIKPGCRHKPSLSFHPLPPLGHPQEIWNV
jgi:hypothetical protein